MRSQPSVAHLRQERRPQTAIARQRTRHGQGGGSDRNAAMSGRRPRRRGAWRFLPIALITAGLALGYALGWHALPDARLPRRHRDVLQALVAAHPFPPPLGYRACLRARGRLLVSGRLGADDHRRLPVRLGCSVRRLPSSPRPSARRRCFWRRAPPSARNSEERLGRRLPPSWRDGFERDAFAYLLVLRLAPFIPFVARQHRAGAFQRAAADLRRRHRIGIVPGAIRLCLARQGLDSVLARRQQRRAACQGHGPGHARDHGRLRRCWRLSRSLAAIVREVRGSQAQPTLSTRHAMIHRHRESLHGRSS